MADTPILRNALKDTLAAGGLGLTMIVKQVQSVDIALAAKTAGYDAINVDLEHSVISEHVAAQICITAQALGVTPIVRVPSHDAHYATRILDAGAMGIVAPHVDTAEQARAIVRACKYAPLGERSVAGQWPQLAYQTYPAAEVRRVMNEQTMVIVMLETPRAVENAMEIAAVPGVDILHVGTTDLCDAFGIPGQYGDAQIERAYEKVIAACRKHGKITGCGGLGSDPVVAEKIIRMGARFITVGNEWAFLVAMAKQRAQALRKLNLS